jgi:hypothetical protein
MPARGHFSLLIRDISRIDRRPEGLAALKGEHVIGEIVQFLLG